jgi:hypothetical protein
MSGFDQQLEEFKAAIIEINNYQSFTDSLVKRLSAYEQLLEDNNLIIKRSEITENDWSSTVNFLFKDYSTGITLNSLGVSKFIKKDSIRIELELKNRQYQFLLLNAFEAFEQYLKGAELFIENKPKNDKKKNFSPTKFIVNLHKTIPVISTIIKFRNESNPKFLDEVDLLLTFSLIEQLRHQITHSGGYANNKSLFIKKCLERIGRYNSGKPKSEYTDYLNSFFGTNKYENLICLIEMRDKENPFYYYDRLGDLIKELVSYIIFIHGYIKSTSDVAISVEPLAAPSA